MKVYLNLAKRSNPENNPKKLPLDTLYYLSKDNSYYLSFVQLEKLGINPGSTYDTPLGIYCYHLFDYQSEIISVHRHYNNINKQLLSAKGYDKNILLMEKARKVEWQMKNIFPFATGAKYMYLFQNLTGNLLNLQYYTEEDLAKDVKKLESIYAFNMSVVTEPPLVDTPGGKIWNYTYHLAKSLKTKYSVTWNKIFQSLGYDGATDNGDGVIHQNEIKQTVFFTTLVLKKRDILRNEQKFISQDLYYHGINNLKNEEAKLKMLLANPKAIKWLRNPSDNLLIQLVTLKNNSIYYIKNPSEAVQLAAIQVDPANIFNIKRPTEKVQILTVQSRPKYLGHLKNASLAVQTAAITVDPYAIQYVENPSEELQLLAIKGSKLTFSYIKNTTPKIVEYLK